MIYLAYWVSRTSYYDDDGGGSRDHECVIDGDTELDVLRARLNDYWSTAEQMRAHRNQKIFIEPGEMKSNSYYGGSGCWYEARCEIRELRQLPFRT